MGPEIAKANVPEGLASELLISALLEEDDTCVDAAIFEPESKPADKNKQPE